MLYYFIFIFTLNVVSVYSEILSNRQCPYGFRAELALKKEGFHRTADYYLELLPSNEYAKCKVCIEQHLPNGLYANKDQIYEMVRLGMLAAYVDGPVDIEVAADVARSHTVYLFAVLTSSGAERIIANISLPFHVRYHRARKGGGFEEAIFPRPNIFVNCDSMPQACTRGHDLRTCPAEPSQDSYVPINYQMVDKSADVLIPVGNSSHYEIVQLFTFIITWAGSKFIYYTLLKYKPHDNQ